MLCNSLPKFRSRKLPSVMPSDADKVSAWRLWRFGSGEANRRMVSAISGCEPLGKLCEYEARIAVDGSRVPYPTFPLKASVPCENRECSSKKPVVRSEEP